MIFFGGFAIAATAARGSLCTTAVLMTEAHVALWAPDIRPPDDWLVPAVLYQERIATIAPFGSDRNVDSQTVDDLREQLGELWQAVRFGKPSRDLTRETSLLPFLQERLALWVQFATSTPHLKNDAFTQAWLERVNNWPDIRKKRLRRAIDEAEKRYFAATKARENANQTAESIALNRADVEANLEAIALELRRLEPVLASERSL